MTNMNHLQPQKDVLPDRPFTPVEESEDGMLMFIPVPNQNGSVESGWVERGSEVVGGKEYVTVVNRYDFEGENPRRYTRQELDDASIAADRERDARRKAREIEPLPVETREAVGEEALRAAEHVAAIEKAFNSKDDDWGVEAWDGESAIRLSKLMAGREASQQPGVEGPQAQADRHRQELLNLQATRMSHSPVAEAAPAARADVTAEAEVKASAEVQTEATANPSVSEKSLPTVESLDAALRALESSMIKSDRAPAWRYATAIHEFESQSARDQLSVQGQAQAREYRALLQQLQKLQQTAH